MATMTPMDLFNLLSEAEKDQIKKSLLSDKKEIPVCVRLGHKYKKVADIQHWFSPPQIKMVCERCGGKKIV